MAVEDVDDPEVKDEELVDFEGSDYDTGSEEEFEIETEVFGTQVTEEPRELKSGGEAERPLSENTANIIESAGEIRTQGHVGRKEDSESPDLQVPSSHREAAESGEIEEEKDDKDEGAVLQPRSNTRLDALKPDPAVGIGEVRETKHRKPDLEDGELDDASMVMPFSCISFYVAFTLILPEFPSHLSPWDSLEDDSSLFQKLFPVWNYF